MPDTRFLKQRHHRYWFQIAVPKALWEHYGRRTILENLDTKDRSEAQTRRWRHVAKWREAFRRATKGEALTPEEIEAEAQGLYRRVLRRLREVEPSEFGPSDDPVMNSLQMGLAELRDALDEGPVTYMASSFDDDADPDTPLVENVYPFVDNEIDQFLERMGAVEIDDAGRREIAEAFLRAHIRATETAIVRRTGLDAPPVGILNTNYRSYEPVTATDARGLARFSQLAKDYLVAIADNWTHKTLQQNTTAYRLFQDHVEDKPVAEVTRGDAAKFFDRLSRLRPRWASSPTTKGLPLNELLVEQGAGPGELGLSAKTQARYRSALYGLFAWAIDRELYSGANPFTMSSNRSSNRKGDKDTSWQPYEIAELRLLLSGLKFETCPKTYSHDGALAWITVVALYSGARLEEIAGLRTRDILEERDVPYFDLQNTGRRLKTRAARRKVPIHPELIRLGLLDYAVSVRERGHEYLFPSLKPGDGKDARRGKYIGKRFNDHREKRGVARDRLSFHSLRSTVSTTLDRAGVPENHTAQLLGHKIRTMSYGLYSAGLDIEGLQRVVETIKYPGLEPLS